MKINVKLITLFLVLTVSAGALYLYFQNKNVVQQAKKQGDKERVICSSTVQPKCFKYKCNTGYFPDILPPGGPGLCSDGSIPVQLEEVVIPK